MEPRGSADPPRDEGARVERDCSACTSCIVTTGRWLEPARAIVALRDALPALIARADSALYRDKTDGDGRRS